MGWNALLFGDLELPPGALDRWRTLRIEEGLYRDWARSSMMGEPAHELTVEELIEKLADHARWCDETYDGPDHQRLTLTERSVSLRAQINEDDFRYWNGLVATMFRLGEKVGAEGEYLALASDEMAGERLVISGGTSRHERVDLVDEMMRRGGPSGVFPYQPILDEISAVTSARLQARAATPKKAPPREAQAAKTLLASSAASTKTSNEKTSNKKTSNKKTSNKKTSNKNASNKNASNKKTSNKKTSS
ncbi:MAG: hypothetical protein U0353_30155, partial [Sandaracinus sp.]